MEKPYPDRLKDRWEHALTRPLTRRTTYEVIELMRADLFEYLDVLTTDPYDDNPAGRAWRDNEIQRAADRLKELTPHRARAAQAAMKAGRVDYAYVVHPEEANRGPECGPFSGPGWQELHQLWKQAQ